MTDRRVEAAARAIKTAERLERRAQGAAFQGDTLDAQAARLLREQAALARHEMRGWNAAIEKAIQEMRALGMAHAAHVIRALKREEKDHGQDKVL